ncbi:hypothetical protein [Accumulibacter sp.]|uniref:hypothetical protein n=1 Tax=Accumulibacter sp. TaxID=2053492 RepID=UPI002617451F|nr:hypothetical protein [Accumulibacter sp.]
MAGTQHIDSWLIENRVLPALRENGRRMLRFSLRIDDGDELSAKLMPLPDGSALACPVDGSWSACEAGEAAHEVAYIGYRYASGNQWTDGFQATRQLAEGSGKALTPSTVATVWQEFGGTRPASYSSGAIGQLQALGSEVLDKAFNTGGRLGL